jgi:hypothetical protein
MVAKKIADKLCNENKMKKKIMFTIRETTTNSKKKTYHYTAFKNKNTIHVISQKRFIGGLPLFPEKFKLKNKDGKYLSFAGYNEPYIYTDKENDGTTFNVLVNDGKYAIKKDGLVGKSIYYDNAKYHNSYDKTLHYQFSKVALKMPNVVLHNSISNDFFEVVPVVEAPKPEAPKPVESSKPKDNTREIQNSQIFPSSYRSVTSYLNDR